MEKERLYEIIASHGRWLRDEGGKRADLSGANLYRAELCEAELCEADLCEADLCEADLHGANLYKANLERVNLIGANLHRANLIRADLEGADLAKANLCGANLHKANLDRANLEGANLEGTTMPIGIYQIVGPGSCNRCTTYDTVNNQIICGCWDDGAGNHLDSFIKRIEEVYGPYGEGYHPIYYTEYMAAVNFFKAMKELKENHDKQGQI